MTPSTPRTVIAANASYVPTRVVPNSAFLAGSLLDAAGRPFAKPNEEIVAQLEAITGIRERRYVEDDQVASDIALAAARAALERSGVDPESLDLIIVAHNFGDVAADNRRSDFVPSLAARVKHGLAIENPWSVAFDVAFGCPGWLQGVLHRARRDPAGRGAPRPGHRRRDAVAHLRPARPRRDDLLRRRRRDDPRSARRQRQRPGRDPRLGDALRHPPPRAPALDGRVARPRAPRPRPLPQDGGAQALQVRLPGGAGGGDARSRARRREPRRRRARS